MKEVDKIYVPDHLDDSDYLEIMDEISSMKEEHPECKDDFFLVDEIDGELNIKTFIPETLTDLCIKMKKTQREVIMAIMRMQNTEGREKMYKLIGKPKLIIDK